MCFFHLPKCGVSFLYIWEEASLCIETALQANLIPRAASVWINLHISGAQESGHKRLVQARRCAMQAPMLAGEMENMFAAPIGNSQWVGSQGGPGIPLAQAKSEQAAPQWDAAQGGQTGAQDSSSANMSDQMLQILEQLKRGG